ncbi:hypothetical protein I350_06434 [Cryptococcus amylolentus CBS 6273]|uniref:Uncharacterized protein n=1 Tax=Cryptococcus amylolentus CBS 6273 TaxID=1296118 RepID=A0A1E3JL76_9TREE|nr:hypothetical protein I350_06434 [Cryptococcus amylolentus CBS 6273]
MAPTSFIFRIVDKFVDGEVTTIRCGRRKYTIPSCYKDIYWPQYKKKTHGKHETYREVEHLVTQARLAAKHGDIRPFYRIYCLFAELGEHYGKGNTGESMCGSTHDPKHLAYESNVGTSKNIVVADKQAMRYLKAYAWFMEGILPSPLGKFRLGAASVTEVFPFLGPVVVFLTSMTVYCRTISNVSAPFWLCKEMLFPLMWSIFFSFFFPEVGDLAASSISPSRRAARKLKYLLKLRGLLVKDQKYDDGLYISTRLSDVFPELPGDGEEHEWAYPEKLREELYGGKDFLHLVGRKNGDDKV